MRPFHLMRRDIGSLLSHSSPTAPKFRALVSTFAASLMLLVFTCSAYAGQLSLAWDTNPEPQLGGYKVHYGQKSKNYTSTINVGKKTSYIVTGLTEGKPYYFAVTAYDKNGKNESGFSNEITTTTPSSTLAASFNVALTTGKAPLAVAFSDTSTGNVTAWKWTFGDGGTSTTRHPSYTYKKPGTYTVALTVSGGGKSHTITKSNLITVTAPAPVASFNAAAAYGTVPLAVSFTDTSTGNITTWKWTFGDGGTSTARHPSYTYKKPGTYTVALTVSGPGGSHTVAKSNLVTVIAPAPVANFGAAPTTGPAPLAVAFADSSTGNITAWKWTFGDGGTSTARHPSYTYKKPGTYTVALTVSGPNGSHTTTKPQYITVASALPLEAGEVQADHRWKRVTLTKAFTNPVVVATTLSHNHKDPAVVRIRNVRSTDFEIRVQEWDYLDGTHPLETIGYLVMERGNYTLPDGTRVEAGSVQTNKTGKGAFAPVTFNKPFQVDPVVLTAVTTVNEADAVTTRLRKISTSGFEVGMLEQERNTQMHATETIAYIAWEPSAGTLGDFTFEVNRTSAVVTHVPYSILYETTFSAPPVFLAHMQTVSGGDTANLRWDMRDLEGVDVWVAEEQSLDAEVARWNPEGVGYVLIK